MTLSIIVPVLDESASIEAALTALAPYQTRGCEVVVVDGGSRDKTLALASPLADHVLTAPRGRAAQMNAGASVAHGDIFLFLHADTKLPASADALIRDGLAQSGRIWGRFDVRFDQARDHAVDRRYDEPALAADRNRDWRPGDLCDPGSVRRNWRLPGAAADGGYSVLGVHQAHQPPGIYPRARHDVCTPLAQARHSAYRISDVAIALGLFSRRGSGAPRAPIRLCRLILRSRLQFWRKLQFLGRSRRVLFRRSERMPRPCCRSA